jgi:hypothetical protein
MVRKMKNKTSLLIALFATATMSFIGCSDKGYQLAPVSGKITADGNPIANIRVVFAPRTQTGDAVTGPWSSGITNEQGEFTLFTRYDEKGAVVGVNDVSFAYDDMDPDTYEDLLDELAGARNGEDKAEFERIKKAVAEAKVLLERPAASEELTEEFEVTSGGSSEANFDINETE